MKRLFVFAVIALAAAAAVWAAMRPATPAAQKTEEVKSCCMRPPSRASLLTK